MEMQKHLNGKRSALLVDDSSVNRIVGRAVLLKLGLQVDMASDGDEAVRACHSKDYDLIFLDLEMPRMDGLEAARRIRKCCRGKHQPYIICASTLAKQRITACRKAGMDSFVPKPMTLGSVGALLSQVATYA